MPERHAFIAAHPDDDLVFMSPTLLDQLRDQLWVQTIYLTAGDAGRGADYWQARETGIVAAYAAASGVPVEAFTAHHEPLCHVRTVGPRRITLRFVRLPDGMLDGQGTPAYQHQSLSRLVSGACSQLHAVDGAVSVTAAQLHGALVSWLQQQNPHVVHVLHDVADPQEHPDHGAAGQLGAAAAFALTPPVTVRAYMGSVSPQQPENVRGPVLQHKRRIFAAYSAHDPLAQDPLYEAMLTRQYALELENPGER